MRDIWITALAPILWGTSHIVTTEFLPPDRPLFGAVLRALPIGIVITVICRTYPRGHWWWRSLVLGTLNIGGFFTLLFMAAYRLPGGVVTTVGALQPLIVMFLTWVFLNQRPPLLAVGAGGLGIVGVVLLVFDPAAQLDTIGVLAAIGAASSMAAGIVLTKSWGSPVSLLPFTAWQFVAGGIIVLPAALLLESIPPTLTPQNIAGYLWIGLANTGLAYMFWFWGIKRLVAYQISFLVLCSPVVAILLGYIFLAQGFGVKQWFGIALVLTSIILAQYAQQASREFSSSINLRAFPERFQRIYAPGHKSC